MFLGQPYSIYIEEVDFDLRALKRMPQRYFK